MTGAAVGGGSDDERVQRAREAGEIPPHVAIIMDGNGRWARERDLARWEGHRRGMEAVREAVKGALELGIEHLTLFAFSRENWARPDREIEALMELLEEFVEREKEELRSNGVRVRVFGELDDLPASARSAAEALQAHTRHAGRMQLNLAISYSARSEIAHAAARLARKALLGTLQPEEIDEERFARELYTAEWPDPDLLIRTSGELRISNFLLWQIAYAEIHVTDVLWPDFDRGCLCDAVEDYRRRDRRFGRVEVG